MRILIIVALLALFYCVYNTVRKEKQQKAQMQEAEQKKQEQIRRQNEQRKKDEELQREIEQRAAKKEEEIQKAISCNPGSEAYRLEKYQYEVKYDSMNITEFTPISKSRFVAFDLETTGLSPGEDAIIEIGAVRVENGVITEEFQQLVNPDCSVPDEASRVNHITDNMLIGQPKIHEVLPAFLAFVGDDVLAAHNAKFDAGFILQACMRNRFKTPERFFDTMTLARYWPDAANRKLSTLIAEAGIKNDEAHRALGDARAVANLILATNEKRKKARSSKKQSK